MILREFVVIFFFRFTSRYQDMSLDEAHDIGEALQLKLENLDRVDRAFVHLDYECIHHPSVEHKRLVLDKAATTNEPKKRSVITC